MERLSGITLRQLDDTDYAIIAQLAEDGRRTNAAIAAALGIGQWVVKKRIDRLLGSGALEILAIVNPARLGYDLRAISGVKTSPDKAKAVVAALADFDEVVWAGRTTSAFNVLVEVRLPSAGDLFDLVRRVSEIPGALSVETFVILRQTLWKAAGWTVSPGLNGERGRWSGATWAGQERAGAETRPGGRTGEPEQLDGLDRRIVSLLMRDGRRPAAEIARITDVSPSTVTVRIDRLIRRGVCRVAAILEPEKLGLTAHSVLGVRVDPPRMAEVGEALTCVPQVFWVSHLSGWYDILADVWLDPAVSLLDFLADHVLSIPGVRCAEAFAIEDSILPRPPEWALSDSASMRRSHRRGAGPPASDRVASATRER
jgi:DNA-binding Lrp family transcriptional regulator